MGVNLTYNCPHGKLVHSGKFFVGFTVISQGFLVLQIHSVEGPARLVDSIGRTFHTEAVVEIRNWKLAGNKYTRDTNTKYSWLSKQRSGRNPLQKFFSSKKHLYGLKKTPIQLISTLSLRILHFSAFAYYKAITLTENVTMFFGFCCQIYIKRCEN